MPSKSIGQIFKELPTGKKLVGIGSLLLILSLFLPWYSDIDSFKTGDLYLGITGPLYLAGFSMLAMNAFNLLFLSWDIYKNKPEYLKIKKASYFVFCGIFSLYMLVVVNSVYFHNKFGLNITMKESQFGMYIAFLGCALALGGAYLVSRDKGEILQEFVSAAELSDHQGLSGEKKVARPNTAKNLHQTLQDVDKKIDELTVL